ncbi:MAG: hypothetical protein AAF509_09420 [Pseudomonadota bacterium]
MPRLSDVALAENPPVSQALAANTAADQQEATVTALAEGAGPAPRPRRGLRNLFGRVIGPTAARRPNAERTAKPKTAEPQRLDEGAADATLASSQNQVLPSLARLNSPSAGGGELSEPGTIDTAFGTKLPFGVLGRTCDAHRKLLGRATQTAPARGYRLYDSAPTSNAPRSFYITGFADGCARQLTATNVMFGAPSFYELLLYGPAGADLPVAETDRAYERIKRNICGARKGRPCGAKIRQLERTTFFISAYPGLYQNAEWAEMLVHDGAVVATAIKQN